MYQMESTETWGACTRFVGISWFCARQNDASHTRVRVRGGKSEYVTQGRARYPRTARGGRLHGWRRSTEGAAAPLHLWASMESGQSNAGCPLELFGLPIGAAPDHAQSHLAMGRVHAGQGPQVGPLRSPRPPTDNLGNGSPHGLPTVNRIACIHIKP